MITIEECRDSGKHLALWNEGDRDHPHACSGCGEPLPPEQVNSSNVIDGWFHGRCLGQRVTLRQEMAAIDVELSGIGWMLDGPGDDPAMAREWTREDQ